MRPVNAHFTNHKSNKMESISTEYKVLSSHDSEYIEIQLPVIGETEKAICFDTYSGYLPKEKKAWIPKSQMKIINMGPDSGIRYFVKKWLYTKF